MAMLYVHVVCSSGVVSQSCMNQCMLIISVSSNHLSWTSALIYHQPPYLSCPEVRLFTIVLEL